MRRTARTSACSCTSQPPPCCTPCADGRPLGRAWRVRKHERSAVADVDGRDLRSQAAPAPKLPLPTGAHARAAVPLQPRLCRLRQGFRVTTNTTLFDGASAIRMQMFFDEMMDLGVEGMMLSPGYSYSKAPDQEHFLRRQKTHELFSKMLSNPKKRWKFNQSPLFLQFLMGKWDFECTPWGNPTYNMFGWQRPCYLLQEGYAATFKELMETTRWEGYGHRSGNEKCKDCMVHCGYEPTAVNTTFTSWKGFKATVEATLTGRL